MKTLLELRCEFNKVKEYKVDIKKSLVFLNIRNEQLEIKILKY